MVSATFVWLKMLHSCLAVVECNQIYLLNYAISSLCVYVCVHVMNRHASCLQFILNTTGPILFVHIRDRILKGLGDSEIFEKPLILCLWLHTSESQAAGIKCSSHPILMNVI